MADSFRERGNPTGATGKQVAQNVRAARMDSNLTQADLSARLAALGHPIPESSIGKLEKGTRKIDVDDFFALAVALEVSPLRLLLPNTRRPGDPAAATGVSTTAKTLWEWGVGSLPLETREQSEDAESDIQAFRSRSLPWWILVSTELPAEWARLLIEAAPDDSSAENG